MVSNNRPLVIFLSGFKRSGKDTCAKIIEEELIKMNVNLSCEIRAFADNIREIVQILFCLDKDAFNDKNKEAICNNATELYKAFPINESQNDLGIIINENDFVTHRNLLDAIGQEMKNIVHPNIWVHSIEEWIRNKKNDVYIIPDLRFLPEIELIERLRADGYNVLWIDVSRDSTRPSWLTAGLNPNSKNDLEVMIKEYKATTPEYERLTSDKTSDIDISNSGDISDLRCSVRNILLEKCSVFFSDFSKHCNSFYRYY